MGETQHISDRNFRRFQRRTLRGLELTLFKQHLLWCLPCLERAEQALRGARRALPACVENISAEDLERYYFGQLVNEAAAARIGQHLSDCRECSERLLATEQLIRLVYAGAISGGIPLVSRPHRKGLHLTRGEPLANEIPEAVPTSSPVR